MADERQYTTTTKFLLRPLGVVGKDENISTSRIGDFGFINAFIKDVDHESVYTHPVYILFKQEEHRSTFMDFIEEEYEKGTLLEDYDYPENYIVLVYDYPERFKDDYDKVINGEYSKTSGEFQNMFPESSIINGTKEVSMYMNVFKKHPDLRKALEKEWNITLDKDSEVRTVPFLGRETLNIKNYINV